MRQDCGGYKIADFIAIIYANGAESGILKSKKAHY